MPLCMNYFSHVHGLQVCGKIAQRRVKCLGLDSCISLAQMHSFSFLGAKTYTELFDLIYYNFFGTVTLHPATVTECYFFTDNKIYIKIIQHCISIQMWGLFFKDAFD